MFFSFSLQTIKQHFHLILLITPIPPIIPIAPITSINEKSLRDFSRRLPEKTAATYSPTGVQYHRRGRA